MDWKHIAIGAFAILVPVEVHYLAGLPWAEIWPAGGATVAGILQIANEYFSNDKKA